MRVDGENQIERVYNGKANSGQFFCVGCKRWMPWSAGAADEFPQHCDDCWAGAVAKRVKGDG